ncbi:F0F1 ATP synthase subunit epsilon [Bizionia paragorgiae]|uniref:F-type H+-transporting ATPase subunit epsilon n=1 Tax=Bizionia paragorgiae TaxID=283786 RepID=A0A1H3YU53_BIZPA|nr:F0F1 ATP synthase subunit epsilon [Bizionia paragorgiae]MDX1271618.1 F0F1 ATP synthase subunit epsilon [Bizionia paragorgiae]SEA15095.1 F-type H+-transporting ATPase subunit epsilon [Bizionia paragorgiae]
MYLEIVSPEATLFSSDIDSVTVPGINGEFQMLNNHVPIVSLLAPGTIKISTHNQGQIASDKLHATIVPHKDDNKVLTVAIQSGTLELKDNKVIILVE